jgi:hypothetical protein
VTGPSGPTDATRHNVNQTAHGFVVGDIVRFNGTIYVKAQADSATNSEVAGIVAVIIDANNFTLITNGYVTGLTGLVAGTTFFLSPSVAGALTATEPTTAGQVTKPLVIADTTTSGYFFNFRGFVVGTPSSGGSSIAQGLYASRPGSGTNVGDTYIATDSPLMSVWTGSVWNTFHKGGELAASPGLSSGYTQVNFGAGNVTLSDVGGVIGMKIIDNGLNLRTLVKAQPSTPYHIEFFLKGLNFNLNSTAAGVYFYDGTKFIGIECLGQNAGTILRVQRWNSITSVGTSVYAPSGGMLVGLEFGGVWLRLGNNGTNLTFDYSFNRGDWWQMYTETLATFITPTHYGFGGVCVTGVAPNFIQLSIQGLNLTA